VLIVARGASLPASKGLPTVAHTIVKCRFKALVLCFFTNNCSSREKCPRQKSVDRRRRPLDVPVAALSRSADGE
jgi:hypothetical protein